MPIHKVDGKWQWGQHGAKYTSRKGAERQAAAAHAAGWTGDERIKGAGICFVDPDGYALFLLRSPEANHPNEWDFPGGHADDNETPEQTARRETMEEIGAMPYGELVPMSDYSSPDDSGENVDFITYRMDIMRQFTPKLDEEEHTAYVWRKLSDPPQPLHPGVKETIDMHMAKDGESAVERRDEATSKIEALPDAGKEGLKLNPLKYDKNIDLTSEQLDKAREQMDSAPVQEIDTKDLYSNQQKVSGDKMLKINRKDKPLKEISVVRHPGGQLQVIDGNHHAAVAFLRGQPIMAHVVDLGKSVETANDSVLAFDRASVRTFDEDGRMRVETTHISKATVNPYRGNEIPGWEELRLDPDRVYMLLRDPEELKKSVPTWNLVPVLNIHIRVSAEDHKPKNIIGSTGTDAKFNAPYLDNSLVIWAQRSIDDIESEEIQEISCGYYYDPDMTPGTYEGMAYDGVMRNIRGNHITIVPEGRAGSDVLVADSKKGRAGPDVLVGDSLTLTGGTMSKALSKKAIMAKGGLLAVLRPILAADSKLDLNKVLSGVTKKNWRNKKPGIVSAIKPHLAKDADLKDVVELLDKLDGENPDNDEMSEDATDPRVEEILNMLRGKISDEDLQEIEARLMAKPAGQATDEPPETKGAANANPKDDKNKVGMPTEDEDDDDKPEMTKAAMDAAIKQAESSATAKAVAKMQAIHEAVEHVRPVVGKLSIAFDSAEDVYKAALKLKGVKTKDIHPSAYRAMFEMLPVEGAKPKTIASDSSLPDDMESVFPNIHRVA